MFNPENIENDFFYKLAFQFNAEHLKKGKVLISEPLLPDPHFSRSVVLLAEYEPQEGAFGFILNKATDLSISELVETFPDESFAFHYGGPVQANHLFFIHTMGDVIPDSKEVIPGLFWSGDFETILSMVSTGNLDQRSIRFFGGYSGWSAGQLENELKENSWIVSDLTVDEIMGDSDLWKQSLKNLGSKFSILADFPENPMMN